MMTWRILSIFIAPLLLCGCVHPSGPFSVDNPDPAVKIPAIKQAVAQDNRSVIPELIKNLDSDDPAVRFYAVQGLRRLTGEDLGYRFYEDKLERRPYIERWQQWLKDHNRPSAVVDAHGND